MRTENEGPLVSRARREFRVSGEDGGPFVGERVLGISSGAKGRKG